jgi:hypothetical protein
MVYQAVQVAVVVAQIHLVQVVLEHQVKVTMAEMQQQMLLAVLAVALAVLVVLLQVLLVEQAELVLLLL